MNEKAEEVGVVEVSVVDLLDREAVLDVLSADAQSTEMGYPRGEGACAHAGAEFIPPIPTDGSTGQ